MFGEYATIMDECNALTESITKMTIQAGTPQPTTRNQPSTPLSRQSVLACLQTNLHTIQAFGVQSLLLFGSVARDEATCDSDLDFLVEFETPATLRGYMGLKFFLEDLFGCSVDLVSRKKLKPLIRDTVLEEAIRVA